MAADVSRLGHLKAAASHAWAWATGRFRAEPERWAAQLDDMDRILGDVGVQRALQYAPLTRCLALSVSTIAQLIPDTIRVVDRQGRQPQGRSADSMRARRVLDLIRDYPDNVEEAYRFWGRVAFDMLTCGNSLLDIRGSRVNPSGLVRMDPTNAEPYRRGGVLTWQLQEVPWLNHGRFQGYNARRVVRTGMQVVHIGWHLPYGSNSILSDSPIRELARAVNIGMKSDEFILEFWAGGPNAALRARAVVQLKGAYTPAQADKAEQKIKEMDGQSPLVLDKNMDLQALDSQPSDSRLTNLREFQAREVARVFGMPAPLLGENVTQWGSGIEHLVRLWWRNGLKQHVEAILRPLGAKLLPPGLQFDIDESDVVRGDTVALKGLIDVLSRNRAISVAEIRRMTGLPPEMDGEPVEAPSGGPMQVNNMGADETNQT